MTVHNVLHSAAQSSSDNFPLILQTTIIAEMLSDGEQGACVSVRNTVRPRQRAQFLSDLPQIWK